MACLKRAVGSAFEIQLTPPSKKQKPSEDKVEYLVLAPFSLYPKVLFQGIQIKTSATRTVVVKNPTDVDIHVELCKLPEDSRGFTWSAREIIVPAGGEESIHIMWCPSEAGNWRDVIKLRNKLKNSDISEIIVTSSAVAPKKVSKGRSGSIRPVINQYTLTANPAVNTTPGVNRNTLTDITNNKNVIFDITSVKGMPKKQEALCKENSPIITPEKGGTFHIRKVSSSNFPECNVLSSVPRRETYNINKGNMTLPATSSPILPGNCSHEETYTVHGERYSVDSLEGSELYDSLEDRSSKEETNSEPSDSPFRTEACTAKEPRKKSISRKSGNTFKTRKRSLSRRSTGKDMTPQKGKNNTCRRSGRRSTNLTENRELIVETKNSMQRSSHTQSANKGILVETQKISVSRRSTFDITDRGLTMGTTENYGCTKSSACTVENKKTVETRNNSTSRRSTFSLAVERKEKTMSRKSSVKADKEITEEMSRNSTSRRSTFNVSNRETTETKENSMYRRSLSTLMAKEEVAADTKRNSMSRRSARITDKHVLSDKQYASEQKPKVSSRCSTNISTAVHSSISETRNRSTFRKPTAFSIGIKNAAAVRRLVLSSTSSSSSGQAQEEDVENAEKVINKISNPDPFIAVTIRDPFSLGSIYLDEEWLDTQEKVLIKWVNTVLTPPKELKEDFEAPMNTILHRLNAIRRATTSLLCSPQMSVTLSKVKVAVDKKLIAIRNDHNLHVDIGMQSKVLQLLLYYNPLWLRLGLEAVYGHVIPLRSNSDKVGLSAFIRKHLLSDDYIRSSYCHPTVPHLMLPEFEDKMKKFTLCKFLMLIYVLDQAKNRKLIHHNPCLFCLDSPFKSSREILLEFYKDLLSGMGDVMKQLRLYGYELVYKQTYLDEFDFTVKTRLDLRDGVRLTRLAELIVQDSSLCSKLRVPPISRLQKVHNVEIAMKAFAEAKYTIVSDITSKSIVDGHKEKTLSLLWQLRHIQQEYAVKLIIVKWRETSQFRKDRRQFLKIRGAAVRIQKWYRKMKQERKLCKKQLQINRNTFLSIRKAVIKIQLWYRAIKLMRVQHENYCKLRNTVIYVQRKYRNMYLMRKVRSDYLKMKYAAVKIQRYYRAWKLMTNDRKVFLELKATAITVQQKYRVKQFRKRKEEKFIKCNIAASKIQKWYRIASIVRKNVSDFIKLKAAAILIQNKFRANKKMKYERHRFIQMRDSAVKIQRAFRNYQLMKQDCDRYIKMKTAATILQRWFRGMYMMKTQRKRYLETIKSAVVIQRAFRSYQLMKQHRSAYKKIKEAAIIIQRWFRATCLMKIERYRYSKLKLCTVFIQNKFRANMKMKYCRNRYLKTRDAAVKIQRTFRNWQIMKQDRCTYVEMKFAAVIIQRYFRAIRLMKMERCRYLELKLYIIIVQNKFRANQKMKCERSRYLQIRNAAIIIQRAFRGYKLMKQDQCQYIRMKNAALVMQKWFRARRLMKTERYRYLQLKSAAVLIQNKFRTHMKMKHEKSRYLKILSATIKIQRTFRNFQIMKQAHLRYQEMKFAAIAIQNYFRATRLMKRECSRYLKLKSSVIVVQNKYRANLKMKRERSKYLKVRNAAITIQKIFRNYLLMKQERCRYLQMKLSAVVLQRYFRANRMMKTEMSRYLALQRATVFIQNKFRANIKMKYERSRYLKIRNSVIIIQKAFRRRQLVKQDYCRYLEMKSAALILQKYFKAFQMMRTERSKYVELKLAVVFVQNRFRANKKMKVERYKYLIMRNAVVTIQRIFRGYQTMKGTRARYIEMKFAATTIQKHFRAWQLMKSKRDRYVKLKIAVVFTQIKFRANVKMRNVRSIYLKIRNAAVTIQRAFRAKKLMIQDRDRYLSLKNAVAVVQKHFRARRLMKRDYTNYMRIKSAVIVIQNQFRKRKAVMAAKSIYLERKIRKLEEEKKQKAAILIQALWRGYRCRKSVKIEIKQSNTEKSKQRTLRERSEDVLDHLMVHPRSVRQIILCLYTLDTVTTLSSKLCRELVDGGIVPRLYNLLDSTCRSMCDVVICEMAIKVMINLYKYSVTAVRTWQDTVRVNGVTNLLNQMLHSYMKEERMFCNAVTLLWLFAHDPSKAEVIINAPKACETLKYISRKLHQEKPKCVAKTKYSTKTVHELPNTKHDWGYYEKPTAFTNKEVALANLLTKLNIKVF